MNKMAPHEQIIDLLRENPPRINLLRFLKNKHWAQTRGEDGRFPNCAGAVLFALDRDFKALPKYTSPEDMARFIEESVWPEGRKNGSVFWMKNGNLKNDHFGIYLGEINRRYVIFHQRNYGDKVSIDTISPIWGINLGYRLKFYIAPDFI